MLLAKKNKAQNVENFAATLYKDVSAFIAELRAVECKIARALEFTILTDARTGESLGAT